MAKWLKLRAVPYARRNVGKRNDSQLRRQLHLHKFDKFDCQETSLTFGATTEDSKLDISMKGSESGRQIIRFNVGTWEGTDANINDVIVDPGRLDIGMRTGMTGNRLSLVGT